MSLAQECKLLMAQISQLTDQKQNLRQEEQNLAVTGKSLASQYQLQNAAPNQLRSSLASFLPRHMQPANVGELDDVAWMYSFPFDFDFGTNPTLTATSFQERQVQVDQEAGFLLMGASINMDAYSESGFLGPYTMTIRDNQSTRQFNDRPVPLQNIGTNSKPTTLPTPLLFMPNATISVRIGTFIPVGETMPTVGSGQIQVMVYGLRVRITDAKNVLSTVFSR